MGCGCGAEKDRAAQNMRGEKFSEFVQLRHTYIGATMVSSRDRFEGLLNAESWIGFEELSEEYHVSLEVLLARELRACPTCVCFLQRSVRCTSVPSLLPICEMSS